MTTEANVEPGSTGTHVVIAGGGVAAVELALALHDLAGDRVRLTIVAPEPDFVLQPLRTAVPFSAGHVRRHGLRELADRVGAELVGDAVTAVDSERHAVRLGAGGSLAYDALVLAVGGRHRTAFPRAMTFTGDHSTLPFNGLLADLEEHWSRSVAFVVPPGTTWPLPLYELALMTARAVRGMGIDDVEMQLVSPEATPLEVFGPAASTAIAELLETAGVSFRGSCDVRVGDGGALELGSGGERLAAERVVALPTIEGPLLAGVPADDHGFIPIDARGRVPGLPDVYAAGDGTTFPVKQGGLACQLADAVAEQLAAAAGADVDPQPFQPVLRGRVLTGRTAAHLEHPLADTDAEGEAPELRLWSAAHKVEGRWLSRWLEELDGLPPAPPLGDEGEHVDVEVTLPPMTG